MKLSPESGHTRTHCDASDGSRFNGWVQICRRGLCFTLFFVSQIRGELMAGNLDAPSFTNEVMAVISKSGCNLGTCHGHQYGKGGLKLSLRGQSPDRDYVALAREFASRRINPVEPEASLMLRKPLMRTPHEGGRRFLPGSLEHRILLRWISAGTPPDKQPERQLVRLTVEPLHSTVYAPQASIKLTARAEFSDGTQQDVSRLAVYEPSSLFVQVSNDGNVVSSRPGLTTVVVRYLNFQIPARLEFVRPVGDFVWNGPEPANFIDEAVFEQLKRLRVNPSPVCDDTTFVRRISLDLTGLLPTPQQVREFLESDSPTKRSELVDQLLASDGFNDMQALRWSDLLHVEEKTLDRRGVEAFHEWIRDSFADRKPLNQFAAELIAARGSTYTVPQANYYRALRQPQTRGEAAAQVFLGVRLQCAKCHNHPFDRWTQDDYYGWSNFFARIDYKIVENKRRDKFDKHEFTGEQIVLITDDGEVKNPETGRIPALRYLGTSETAGDRLHLTENNSNADRLLRLAGWMGSPDNRRFAETQVNRVWFQLMGRGIVEPVDDFRATNPPTHPELLEKLTKELMTYDFDVRQVMRVILNSQTYQLSALTNATNRTDESGFSHVSPTRMTAEQTLDAICQVLGVSAEFGGYEGPIRAVQLKGVRNGGHRYSPPEIGDRFLRMFGKPGRLQSCECERTNSTTLSQTFEMISGELMHRLLEKKEGRIHRLLRQEKTDAEIISSLYWSALSRSPSGVELQAAIRHLSHQDRLSGMQDLAWALLNSNEFLLRR